MMPMKNVQYRLESGLKINIPYPYRYERAMERLL